MCGFFIVFDVERAMNKWVWQSFPEPSFHKQGWYLLRLHTLDGGMLHRCEYTLSPTDLRQKFLIPHIKKRMKRLMLDALVENRENIGRQGEVPTLLN